MILKTLTHEGRDPNQQSEQGNSFNIPLLNEKGLCQYQNIATVQKISQSSITPNQIKVSNKLCKQNGEFMQKITIVKFNDQVITIKDRYRFTTQPQHNIDSNLQKRIHIFKKPLHAENKNEGKRRVTKNLPKNFIKAFLNYLELVKDQQNSQLLDCKMKLFSSRQKYNNSFIQRIVDDPDLEHYFNQFLNKHAKQWIQKSKIRDKDVHFEAIEVFKKLTASKPGESKQQNFGQLDCCLSSFQDESQRISQISKQKIESDKESIIANSSKSDQLQKIQQQQ